MRTMTRRAHYRVPQQLLLLAVPRVMADRRVGYWRYVHGDAGGSYTLIVAGHMLLWLDHCLRGSLSTQLGLLRGAFSWFFRSARIVRWSQSLDTWDHIGSILFYNVFSLLLALHLVLLHLHYWMRVLLKDLVLLVDFILTHEVLQELLKGRQSCLGRGVIRYYRPLLAREVAAPVVTILVRVFVARHQLLG